MQPGMRAGDSDRQKVADQLKSALDEGRLDIGEYDERLQRAYAAKTFQDLDGLLDDLPGAVPLQRSRVEPHQATPIQPVAPAGKGHPGRSGVTGMIGVFLVCVVVWAMTSFVSGEPRYFWPGWVLIPVIFAVVGHLADRNKRSR